MISRRDPTSSVSRDWISRTASALQARNIAAPIVETGQEAVELAMSLIVPPATVLTGGSHILSALGLPEWLRRTPGVTYANDQFRAHSDAQARVDARRAASASDYVLGSANAVAVDGRIVNINGGGSRVAAYAFSARKVILIVGHNELCQSSEEAMARQRTAAVWRMRERGQGSEFPPCFGDGVCRESDCYPPVRECENCW